MSAVPLVFGEGAEASADKCVRVEDQKEVWEEAEKLGCLIGDRLRAESKQRILQLSIFPGFWKITLNGIHLLQRWGNSEHGGSAVRG